MSTISLRLPNSLHERVRELAARENISINQFIPLALAEKLSVMLTEEYLVKRTARGSKKKFRRALAKVSKGKPADYDRL